MIRTLYLHGLLFLVGHSCLAADWPRWRGLENTGHIPPGVAVPTSLPAEPKILWQIKISDGLGSPVVTGGRVFYLDHQEGKEVVHAVSAANGQPVWNAPLDEVFRDGQSVPGPRGTPVVDGDRVYVQSCRGEFRCLNVADGKRAWGVNFVQDFDAVFIGEKGAAVGASRHGYNGSPVIDGDRIIVGVGGTNGASVVCFGKRDGRVIWKSRNDIPGYSGPVIATIAGTKQVVSFKADGVIGLEAATGALLWRVPVKTSFGRHVTTPVVVGDMVMVSSHEAGLIGIKVTKQGQAFTAEAAWSSKESAINFASPVAVGDYLYGLGPAKKLVCVEVRTGKQMWANADQITTPSGKAYAAFLATADRLLVLTDDGRLLLIAADPKEFRLLSSAAVCGKNWCNPAYADGQLFVRDSQELRCVQLLP